MKIVVLSAVLSVWMVSEYSVDGALTISYLGSNKVDSTTYRLKCEIPTFNSQAAWNRDGSSMSICFNSGCLTTSLPLYNFSHDSSAIYVAFNKLTANEDGIQWICEHSGDTADNFNVSIDFSVATTEASIEGTASSGGSNAGTIAGIVLGVIGGVVVCVLFAFLVYKIKLGQSPCLSTQPQVQRSKQEAKIGSQVELLPKLCKLKLIQSVKWFYNDEPDVIGEDIKYEGGNRNRPSLTIRCVSQEDFGSWGCILETKTSKQNFVVQLISKD